MLAIFFFFSVRTKQVQILFEYWKVNLEIPLENVGYFVCSSAFFVLSFKDQVVFLQNPCFVFPELGETSQKILMGSKVWLSKRPFNIFVYFDGSWVFLKVIYNIGFKNISPFRMFLLKSFATENLPRQFKHNKTIRFCLLWNAALEIILYDKLSNIMLMFGWRKRRKLHLIDIFQNYNKQLNGGFLD